MRPDASSGGDNNRKQKAPTASSIHHLAPGAERPELGAGAGALDGPAGGATGSPAELQDLEGPQEEATQAPPVDYLQYFANFAGRPIEQQLELRLRLERRHFMVSHRKHSSGCCATATKHTLTVRPRVQTPDSLLRLRCSSTQGQVLAVDSLAVTILALPIGSEEPTNADQRTNSTQPSQRSVWLRPQQGRQRSANQAAAGRLAQQKPGGRLAGSGSPHHQASSSSSSSSRAETGQQRFAFVLLLLLATTTTTTFLSVIRATVQ